MKKIWRNSLFATAFTFGILWAADKIMELQLFNAFDVFEQAFADFELTDYAFSNLRPDPTVDDRIVLVNIGYLPRPLIAEQIRIISKYKPKVIGIDSFFNCEGGLRDTLNCPQLKDTLGNLMLSFAIQEAGNVVHVSKLLQSYKTYSAGIVNVYDSLEFSDPIFQDYAQHGFANLVTDAEYQHDVKLCRSFNPTMEVNGETQYAFSVRLAMMYDSAKAAALLARDKEEEIINYRGNVEIEERKLRSLQNKELATTRYPIMFFALDAGQVLREEFDAEFIKDKIVIFGFLGEYFGDPAWEDKFFTPLNKKVAGRANPDMFGLVVHANIVAMILNGDFVDELEEWHKYVLAFLFCYVNMLVFFYINARFPVWFDTFSLLIQVVQIIALMFVTVLVFAHADFKLDLTLTIFTIAFAGPSFEFYDNILNTGLVRIWQKRLTKRKKEVLTTQDTEIS